MDRRVTQNTIALNFEFSSSTLPLRRPWGPAPRPAFFPLDMGSIARSCGDRPVERGDAQAERIARTALEGVCMPLLSTSSEPSTVVSTRVTAAVT